MTKTKLQELQTEIARLQQIDKETTEKVAAEFAAEDRATELDTMGSFDENGDALEFTTAWTQEDVNDNLTIECSLQQDMEWANESENIQ